MFSLFPNLSRLLSEVYKLIHTCSYSVRPLGKSVLTAQASKGPGAALLQLGAAPAGSYARREATLGGTGAATRASFDRVTFLTLRNALMVLFPCDQVPDEGHKRLEDADLYIQSQAFAFAPSSPDMKVSALKAVLGLVASVQAVNVDYTTVKGFFLQDESSTDPSTFDYVC